MTRYRAVSDDACMHHRVPRPGVAPALALALAFALSTAASLAVAAPAAAADFPAGRREVPHLRRDGRRDPGRRRPPTPTSSSSSRSARATRAATSGSPRSPTTSPPTSPSPRSCSTASTTPASTSRSSRPSRSCSWLAEGYGTDTRITNIVNTREIWIVFAVNPDGAEYDLTGSPYRAWRKNRQPNAGSTAIGTDINRNYGYHWACCGGSSATQVVRHLPRRERLLDARRPARSGTSWPVVGSWGVQQIKTAITFHTAGEQILWPYGYTTADVPADMTSDDHAALVALGKKMATTNGYTAMQSSSLYVTDGDEIDWAYGIEHIFMYTFEMYPTPRPGELEPAVLPTRRADRHADPAQPRGDPPAHRGGRLSVRADRQDQDQLRPAVRRLRDVRRLDPQPARHRHRDGWRLAAGQPGGARPASSARPRPARATS